MPLKAPEAYELDRTESPLMGRHWADPNDDSSSDLSEIESATIWHLNIGPSSGPAGAAFSQVSFLGLFQINKG